MTESAVDARPVRPVWDRFAGCYDRTPILSSAERVALVALAPPAPRRHWLARPETGVVERLVRPLLDALATLDLDPRKTARRHADMAALDLVRGCWRRQSAYWGWDDQTWVSELGTSRTEPGQRYPTERRQLAIAIAYVLGCFRDVWLLGPIDRYRLSRKIFGGPAVDASTGVVVGVLTSWGYQRSVQRRGSIAHSAVADAVLVSGSADLADITLETLDALRSKRRDSGASRCAHLLHRALHALDILPAPPPQPSDWAVIGLDPTWTSWVERWARTSTNQRTTRRAHRTTLFKAGRWLAATRPEVREPSAWTREICADWVAAVDRMHVGDFTTRLQPGEGRALSASAKARYIGTLRVFFRDCQEWGWIERRFDPGLALLTPRAVRNTIGPNPRVIDDVVWAKLLWAGLNLGEDDLPAGGRYPLELFRALALAWLFSGSRSNEIVRLRVGCVRWQRTDDGDPLCLLDIPVTKTSSAFTRPVDPLLGRALEEWQGLRPLQPKLVDWRTGEHVDFLFALRAQLVGRGYLNLRLVPALCAKAGVPQHDVRGRITSHRARATIASQLYNAKEPFSLAELQRWLGHSSPQSTQYYAELTPLTLSRAYRDAGYFARNLRTIEVLIDRDVIESGGAATGEPWRYFDLGHGFCTYSFFEQCPHRMACARCDFYRPKASVAGSFLEGRANLERLLKEVPLTDDERAAVEEGTDALTALLDRLADVPTPAGATPREIASRVSVRLPVVRSRLAGSRPAVVAAVPALTSGIPGADS